MSIYQPREDSYLLQEELVDLLKSFSEKSIKILDMGSGSGIQAITCRKLGFKNITAVDINPESIDYLKKQNLKAIHSNLFNKINKNNKFDLIIFNPPYLPEDKQEPRDSQVQTTGGKYGYEIIVKFFKEAKAHLTEDGQILLLFSSLSKPEVILKEAEKINYKFKLAGRKKLFFEELFVYKFKLNKKSC